MHGVKQQGRLNDVARGIEVGRAEETAVASGVRYESVAVAGEIGTGKTTGPTWQWTPATSSFTGLRVFVLTGAERIDTMQSM